MGKRVKIQTDLTAEELHERYRHATDAGERTHWHMLWQAKEGKTPQVIAERLGYTARWVRTVIGRWNEQGEAGIRDRRHETDVSRPLLSPELQEELAAALQTPPADGGLWSGPKVALWMQHRRGRPVAPQRGWDYLQRRGHSSRVPRPQHAKADEATRQEFQKTSGARGPGAPPAPPGTGGADVAMDEHRIGLKPILRRVWAPKGATVKAPVAQRSEWMDVVAFVHPQNGQTCWLLLPGVNVEIFSRALAAFAEEVGAGPEKQIVLVAGPSQGGTAVLNSGFQRVSSWSSCPRIPRKCSLPSGCGRFLTSRWLIAFSFLSMNEKRSKPSAAVGFKRTQQ